MRIKLNDQGWAFFLAGIIAVAGPASALALNDGQALTPPMGWNPWNTGLGRKISDKIVCETANAMVKSGLRDAGYVYLNIDDCWMAKERDTNGNLVPDPVRFPRGMKPVADYVHAQGLKFGIYESPNALTCAKYPGSKDHEQQDIELFASWGVDFLKYDHCGMQGDLPYRLMGILMKKTGRPMIYSGNVGSYYDRSNYTYVSWAQEVLHMWRTATDIRSLWEKPKDWGVPVLGIIEKQAGLEPFAGPGHWNDPDMMVVGNKPLTESENRAHFSMWCVFSAPLICGNDLRQMTESTRTILTNPEVIAVDQDPAGRQGWRITRDKVGTNNSDLVEVYMKPLADGARAVVLLNRTGQEQLLSVTWESIGLEPGPATVRDLWAHQDKGTVSRRFSARVQPHDCVMIKVKGTPLGFDYVSDLPWDYRENGVGVPERDLSNGGARIRDGQPLTLKGRVYVKGIGVSAPSNLGIRLDGKYRRFTTDIGVDDETKGQGTVVFQVLLDGQTTYDSGAITTQSGPRKVDLDVAGKTEMRLLVKNGGNKDPQDHGDWAGAMLTLGR